MFGRFEQDKHYALNNTSFNLDRSIKMSLDYLDYSNKSLYVSVSNSVGVFKMQGADLNFIHGGISPQNIVIPVLTGTRQGICLRELYQHCPRCKT